MSYQEFVQRITRKNGTWQYREYDDRVDVYFYDGLDYCSHTIYKPSTTDSNIDPEQEAADLADFEANYKANSNFAIGARQYPFSSPDMQFAGEGFKATFPKAGTNDYFYKITKSYYLNGGEYWTSGTVAGDTLQLDVVDHDNLLGRGVDFVLTSPSYMVDWNLLPQDNARTLFKTNYAAKPPAGMYLRFRYTAVGQNNDVTMFCNLFFHKPL